MAVNTQNYIIKTRDIFFQGFYNIGKLLRSCISDSIRNVYSVQTIISVLGMSLFYFLTKPVMDEIWGLKPENYNMFVKRRKESITDLVLNGIKVK